MSSNTVLVCVFPTIAPSVHITDIKGQHETRERRDYKITDNAEIARYFADFDNIGVIVARNHFSITSKSKGITYVDIDVKEVDFRLAFTLCDLLAEIGTTPAIKAFDKFMDKAYFVNA